MTEYKYTGFMGDTPENKAQVYDRLRKNLGKWVPAKEIRTEMKVSDVNKTLLKWSITFPELNTKIEKTSVFPYKERFYMLLPSNII